MKKLASFIVNKRLVILIVFASLALACLVLMNFVNVNYDMTAYLPKDSEARQGLSVMADEFGESSVVRLMIKGLSEDEKETVVEELNQFELVGSVVYEKGSEAYNKGENTLFVINVSAGSFSPEAAEVLEEIESTYKGKYEAYTSGETKDSQAVGVSPLVLFLAFSLLLIILLIMSSSWVEPLLFLVAIGIAILLNEGTNFFLPSVSATTKTNVAILQLVLSMDYSIMLIDRYRQERQALQEKEAAMKNALSGGFLAIAASSATTIVGLLCLIFMSFTIGLDMGIVLAKGVLFSLISILFVLPALVLIFDKAIEKTRKKPLRLKLHHIARFEYKFRRVILPVFLVLFVVGFLLKDNVLIDFTMSSQDSDRAVIEEVFPDENTLVVLYKNEDEEKTARIAELLEEREGINSVTGYSGTVGKEYSPAELADFIGMDESFLNTLYYEYFASGEIGTISLEVFFDFIINDVSKDEQFSEYFNEDVLSQLNRLSALSSNEKISALRNSGELAKLLGMKKDEIDQLFLLYYMENGGIDSGKMTIDQFVKFVQKNVAPNPQFSSFIDKETLSQLNTLAAFSTKNAVLKQYKKQELSALLGMDETMAGQVYYLYYSRSGQAPEWKMTLQAFLNFVINDVAENPQFSSQFDSKTLSQLQGLKGLVDLIWPSRSYTASGISRLIGLDAELVGQLFYMYYGTQGETDDWTMSPVQFVDFILNEMATDEKYSSYFDEATLSQLSVLSAVMGAAAEEKALTAGGLSDILGFDEAVLEQLFLYYQSLNGKLNGQKLSLKDLINFIAVNVAGNETYADFFDDDIMNQISTAKTVTDAVSSGKKFSAQELAELFDIDSSLMNAETLELLYLYYFGGNSSEDSWRLSLYDFIAFVSQDILNDSRFESFFDEETKEQLLSAKDETETGKVSLVGENYSRLIISASYGAESEEAYLLIEELQAILEEGFDSAFIVGNSPVAYEMKGTFGRELNFITLLSAISVFVVVAITFKSLAIPAILVMLIQCAVYMTTAAAYLQGSATYYLALIIVQAILMGATIDYAILYAEYYRKLRKTKCILNSLIKAYEGSIMTILTSGSILFSVTLVVAFVSPDPTTAQVCMTISKGALFAALLVIFVLPALLAVFDRFVCGKNRTSPTSDTEPDLLTGTDELKDEN